MIISDLNHFELVDESTIIGGALPSFGIASNLFEGIADQLSAPIQVKNLITTGNPNASATAGSFTAGLAGQPIQGVFSASSSH